MNNKWWLKVSGRYPTIPVVYDLIDEEAKKLQVAIKSSEYANNATWSNVTSKKAYMNKLFKQEYTGDMYASRLENTGFATTLISIMRSMFRWLPQTMV